MTRERVNAEYDWNSLDPATYVAKFYAVHSPDDDQAFGLCAAALGAATAERGKLDIIDVGTGPSLLPVLAALPFAERLTSWEFSANNVAWLNQQIASPHLSEEWMHYWELLRASKQPPADLPADPMRLLRDKVVARQGSIFDLPPKTWDAATMFFCAESITENRDEFREACARFAGCVVPGGLLVAAFLARASGYEVADRMFPALPLSEEDVQECFADLAVNVSTELIGSDRAEAEIDYSGMIFLTASAV